MEPGKKTEPGNWNWETDQQLKNQDEYIQVQNNREDDQIPLKEEHTTQKREGFQDPGRGI